MRKNRENTGISRQILPNSPQNAVFQAAAAAQGPSNGPFFASGGFNTNYTNYTNNTNNARTVIGPGRQPRCRDTTWAGACTIPKSCYSSSHRPERCQSGRMGGIGNAVYGLPYRGFESHPLRSGRAGPDQIGLRHVAGPASPSPSPVHWAWGPISALRPRHAGSSFSGAPSRSPVDTITSSTQMISMSSMYR